MFDIGFQELLLLGVIALLVMGPERLPEAVRTASLWLGRLRRSFAQIKADIEREVGADEIRQQLHNEDIMRSLEQAKRDLSDGADKLRPELDNLRYDISDVVKGEGEAKPADNTASDKTNTP